MHFCGVGQGIYSLASLWQFFWRWLISASLLAALMKFVLSITKKSWPSSQRLHTKSPVVLSVYSDDLLTPIQLCASPDLPIAFYSFTSLKIFAFLQGQSTLLGVLLLLSKHLPESSTEVLFCLFVLFFFLLFPDIISTDYFS